MSQCRYSLHHETPRSLTTQAENENESDELLSNLNEEEDNKFASLIIETLYYVKRSAERLRTATEMTKN